ncbi:N-acetylmuramoyl-L-alanine amidase [Actinoplanes sp. NPDC051861]|uniref:peptidoglycan recognition protein family protein n=1 Tax=Actinoplanes sp. NPDC051861 TaxID=3155170 RepID=UPI00342831FE
MPINWLADVLRDAGVRVVEEGNWRGRGVSGAFDPRGVLWHHTVGTSSATNPAPALGTVINGRPTLQGPLCHALVDYHGVFHLISANRTNHAGPTRASGPIPAGDGNTMLVGWEIDYQGVHQAITGEQYRESVIATAAVLRVLGRDASYARGHRETSVEGKIDPGHVDLDRMRADVAERLKQPGERFAVVGEKGRLYAKDSRDGTWLAINSGGAGLVRADGNWLVWSEGDKWFAKYGLYDSWRTMGDDGVRDLAVDGMRFAYVNSAGVVKVKDGPDAAWQGLNTGGATKVVLDRVYNRIGWLENGAFYLKEGIFDSWRTMAKSGVRDIAIAGDRFAYVDTDGRVFAKDGRDSSWTQLNSSGAAKVVLMRNWIGWLEGGTFYVKEGLYSSWRTMATGVSDIVAGAPDWFGFVKNGDFFAKKGPDSGFVQLAGSQITAAAIRS